MRLFSKHSEFRADGSTLEEVDTDLNEKRREESERFIELLYMEHVPIRHCSFSKHHFLLCRKRTDQKSIQTKISGR